MKTIQLHARDGYPISATAYGPDEPDGPGGSGRQSRSPLVLIAGATGVAQRFYRRFSEYLVSRGLRALTLDYRGLGDSKPAGGLVGFEGHKLDWMEQDLAAALDWALDRASKVVVVGHSFGGHAYGVLPRANETAGLLAYGTGAGWSGYMRPLERAKAEFFWRVLGPALVGTLGYLPSRRLGLGDDLPRGAFRQWQRWCRHPRYFLDDPGFPHAARFQTVRRPILAVNATDDAWAPPRSARAFFENYASAPREYRTLEPAAVGSRSIGHMGYFRPHIGISIWPQAVDWILDTTL